MKPIRKACVLVVFLSLLLVAKACIDEDLCERRYQTCTNQLTRMQLEIHRGPMAAWCEDLKERCDE